MFSGFIDDDVELVGVEAAGHGLDSSEVMLFKFALYFHSFFFFFHCCTISLTYYQH